jgi:hypothetical protein
MNKGLFYFAHPYTVKDSKGNYVPEAEEANFRLCCYRASRLLLLGYNIYSPISHTHPIHLASPELLQRHEHEMWYKLDEQFLEKCDFDGIILAPGWKHSVGCRAEHTWFLIHKKRIMLYDTLISLGE